MHYLGVLLIIMNINIINNVIVIIILITVIFIIFSNVTVNKGGQRMLLFGNLHV